MLCHKTPNATKRVMPMTMEKVVIIFDFFFRDTLFSVQYRSNAPKLVWVIPRISVYGKRRSTHSFLSDSIADNRMHN